MSENLYSPTDGEWARVLIGREVVEIRDPGLEQDYWDKTLRKQYESVDLILDDGSEIHVDAELGCCAGGEIEYENMIGGRILGVTTEEELSDDGAGESVYRVFVMKGGLPGGLTVTSYESNGYYGTGFSIHVRKPALEVAR